jgi:hypothetical protein
MEQGEVSCARCVNSFGSAGSHGAGIRFRGASAAEKGTVFRRVSGDAVSAVPRLHQAAARRPGVTIGYCVRTRHLDKQEREVLGWGTFPPTTVGRVGPVRDAGSAEKEG